MWFDPLTVRRVRSVRHSSIKRRRAFGLRVPLVFAWAASSALLGEAATARAEDSLPALPAPPASAPHPAPRRSSERTENGEFIIAQQSQTIYVPQSIAPSGAYSIPSWKEGDPVPDGYHTVTRLRKSAVVGGSVLFGTLYVISSFFASASVDAARAQHSTSDDVPLFVPALGPFIRMATTPSAMAGYALAIDGAGQCVGLALFIYGLVVPQSVLVRNDLGKAVVLPMRVGQGGYGVTVRAAF